MVFTETSYGKFHYFAPDAIGQRIASGEFLDAPLKPYFDRLREGDVLVDVGANIGFYSVYAALRGVSVLAFEASFAVFELLKQNVGANSVGNRITAYNVPLYDKSVVLKLNPAWTDYAKFPDGRIDYENSPNSGGMSLIPWQEGDGWVTAKAAVALDSFLMPKVDLLKVDTQGADLRVLVGAEKTIDRCRPVILFEFEPNDSGRNASGDSEEDFRWFFDDKNYKITELARGMHAVDFLAEPL